MACPKQLAAQKVKRIDSKICTQTTQAMPAKKLMTEKKYKVQKLLLETAFQWNMANSACTYNEEHSTNLKFSTFVIDSSLKIS